ncbi:MAG: gliding motility lipoprotein GldH [Dysgonamonadaceae bacterium]|jgi:gliding motility-associated lipoprotein GldH|nr:gliding motility lipoprotein GldH [Dysgonamonadaceae bacterium]
MNIRKIKYIPLWSLLFFGVTCAREEIFSEFHSFREAEWVRNEKVHFEIEINDNTPNYEVLLEIRNNNNYPFQNIWLFIDITTPAGQQRTDTVNIELADVYGKWYGRGISLYTYSVPFEQNVRYPLPGIYTYSIRQGMREEVLKGISDIGLTVKNKF